VAESDKLSLISNVAASYLRRNSVGIDQIESVIEHVSRALQKASTDMTVEGAPSPGPQQSQTPAIEEKRAPAVPIRKSVQREFVVCLEDGFKGRTLRKHLMTAHQLTPEQYREKWGLANNHPIVAPAYSEQRSQMAKKLGLGALGRGARGGHRKRGARERAAARS
jgi:predicted transcriptional regulator